MHMTFLTHHSYIPVTHTHTANILKTTISMPGKLKYVANLFKKLFLFLFGTVIFTFYASFLVLNIPVYLYRFLLSNVVAPFFQPRIGKMLTNYSSFYGVEFLRDHYHPDHPPRCAIVVNIILEGTVSSEEVVKSIQARWISAKTPNGRALKYPEFQQYIESWMGFMFWKQDKYFDLQNHIFSYRISDSDCVSESDNIVNSRAENLLNKPFVHRRSPWEIHLIQNYRNAQLSNVNEPLTVCQLRIHHAMADGFSLLYALIEGLLGFPLKQYQISRARDTNNKSVWERIQSVKSPLKLMYEIGIYMKLYLNSSPWHLRDSKKEWKQLYARSELIPVEKIKYIKRALGASFTGVLLSSISAGICRSIHEKSLQKMKNEEVNYSTKELCKDFPVMVPLPLAGHSDSLRNYGVCAAINLPMDHDLCSEYRLRETENRLLHAKESMFPFFILFLTNVVGAHFARVSKYMLRNRVLPAIISNFPGPRVHAEWQGRKVIGVDFAAGSLLGIAGVSFWLLSYGKYVRLSVSSEQAVLKRSELKQLVRFITEEIEALYESSLLLKRNSAVVVNICEG